MSRIARLQRHTRETQIDLSLNLEGAGQADIQTGIGFFDHMLDQLARHGLFDIDLKAKGDLHIDAHHTVEDCGIVLGQAFDQALGDKAGIARFADRVAVMDEARSQIAIDISGRGILVWEVNFRHPKIGDFDTELFQEFFQALALNAKIGLHVINHCATNDHHRIESCFKALALALRQAVSIDPRRQDQIPSTKGVL